MRQDKVLNARRSLDALNRARAAAGSSSSSGPSSAKPGLPRIGALAPLVTADGGSSGGGTVIEAQLSDNPEAKELLRMVETLARENTLLRSESMELRGLLDDSRDEQCDLRSAMALGEREPLHEEDERALDDVDDGERSGFDAPRRLSLASPRALQRDSPVLDDGAAAEPSSAADASLPSWTSSASLAQSHSSRAAELSRTLSAGSSSSLGAAAAGGVDEPQSRRIGVGARPPPVTSASTGALGMGRRSAGPAARGHSRRAMSMDVMPQVKSVRRSFLPARPPWRARADFASLRAVHSQRADLAAHRRVLAYDPPSVHLQQRERGCRASSSAAPPAPLALARLERLPPRPRGRPGQQPCVTLHPPARQLAPPPLEPGAVAHRARARTRLAPTVQSPEAVSLARARGDGDADDAAASSCGHARAEPAPGPVALARTLYASISLAAPVAQPFASTRARTILILVGPLCRDAGTAARRASEQPSRAAHCRAWSAHRARGQAPRAGPGRRYRDAREAPAQAEPARRRAAPGARQPARPCASLPSSPPPVPCARPRLTHFFARRSTRSTRSGRTSAGSSSSSAPRKLDRRRQARPRTVRPPSTRRSSPAATLSRSSSSCATSCSSRRACACSSTACSSTQRSRARSRTSTCPTPSMRSTRSARAPALARRSPARHRRRHRRRRQQQPAGCWRRCQGSSAPGPTRQSSTRHCRTRRARRSSARRWPSAAAAAR